MSSSTIQRKTQKQFLDIPSAAFQAGYSSRHFRRIIEEDKIPVMQIGRKLFIIARDLEAWKSTKGEARFQQAVQQLDVWIKDAQRAPEPVDDFDDEDASGIVRQASGTLRHGDTCLRYRSEVDRIKSPIRSEQLIDG